MYTTLLIITSWYKQLYNGCSPTQHPQGYYLNPFRVYWGLEGHLRNRIDGSITHRWLSKTYYTSKLCKYRCSPYQVTGILRYVCGDHEKRKKKKQPHLLNPAVKHIPGMARMDKMSKMLLLLISHLRVFSDVVPIAITEERCYFTLLSRFTLRPHHSPQQRGPKWVFQVI